MAVYILIIKVLQNRNFSGNGYF